VTADGCQELGRLVLSRTRTPAKNNSMPTKRACDILMLITLCALSGLLVLSIVGAFLGTERAGDMFTSVPLMVFWAILAAVLLAGPITFAPLRRDPGLLAMHAGCVLVLAGALLGTERGQWLRRLLGFHVIRQSYLRIDREGYSDQLYDQNKMPIGRLPVSVKLDALRLDAYPPASPWPMHIVITHMDESGELQRHSQQLTWSLGKWLDVPETDMRLQVTEYQPAKYEVDNALAEPPIIRARIERAGMGKVIQFSGERRQPNTWLSLMSFYDNPTDWMRAGTPELVLQRPEPMPKNYYADLAVRGYDGEPTHQTVSVNNPLRHGCYYLYQTGFSDLNQPELWLQVVGDPGWPVVFTGFVVLFAGIVWWLWIRPILRAISKSQSKAKIDTCTF